MRPMVVLVLVSSEDVLGGVTTPGTSRRLRIILLDLRDLRALRALDPLGLPTIDEPYGSFGH